MSDAQPKRVSSDHYYDAAGTLFDDVGLKKARELLLYPSVTTIFKIHADAPQLRDYKEGELLKTAYTIDPVPTDTPETWARRVMTIHSSRESDAAAYGKIVHAAVKTMIDNRMAETYDVPTDASEWIAEHLDTDASVESSVVEPDIGYAGTPDYIGSYYSGQTGSFHDCAIIDFKTQNVKALRPRRRETWPWQLAGYAHAASRAGIGTPTCWVNVTLNTNERHPDWHADAPGIWIWEWKKPQIDYGLRALNKLASWWYLLKKFPAPGSPERTKAETELAEREFSEMLAGDDL